MKNINRDYLIKIDARTAEITAVPKNLKFFMTDVWTSNIFFQLDNLVNYDIWDPRNEKSEFPDDADDYAPKENSDNYIVTLRVVKPNNEPKTIEAEPLNQPGFFMADLTVDFIDLVGIYDCELFVDTTINGRMERRTSEPFEYEVKKSVFYNLDEIIDTAILSLEDIATKKDLEDLVVGDYTLDGYVTDEILNDALANLEYPTYDDSELRGLINTKADWTHTHSKYVTRTELDDALAVEHTHEQYVTHTKLNETMNNINDLAVKNSISMNRLADTTVGKYSTAEGSEVTASGYASHAEGTGTIANNYASHSEGDITTASGICSHSEGTGTTAASENQHVQGKYNIEDNDNAYVHIVGNGEYDARSNAHTLDWDGNAWFAGSVFVGGTSQDDAFKLATETYVNNAVGIAGGGSGVAYDDTELRNLIDTKADADHIHTDYATKTYVDSRIWVGTQTEYDMIYPKNPDVIYFIEEED